MDRTDVKAGMSFPSGFGIGFKDKFFTVNKEGKVKKTKLVGGIDKKWNKPIIRGYALLLFVFNTALKQFGAFFSFFFFAVLLLPIVATVVNISTSDKGATLWPIISQVSSILIFTGLFIDALQKFKVMRKFLNGIVSTLTWHAVEHKTFRAMMKGLKPTMANVMTQKKELPECGTVLFAWLIGLSLLSRWVMGDLLGMFDGYFTLFVIFPLLYEAHVWQTRKSDRIWTWYSYPGWFLQKIFMTIEPSDRSYIKAGVKLMKSVYKEAKI